MYEIVVDLYETVVASHGAPTISREKPTLLWNPSSKRKYYKRNPLKGSSIFLEFSHRSMEVKMRTFAL